LKRKNNYKRLTEKEIKAVSVALTSFWKDYETLEFTKNKITMLVNYSNKMFSYFKGKDLYNRRLEFTSLEELKLGKHETCKVCGSIATERHHIIPLRYGGINVQRNIISICKDCHCKIHPWL